MLEFVFWIYFLNLLLFICHEIDSAFWKEWELFNVPGGIAGFLAFNLVVVAFFLYGLTQFFTSPATALLFSAILSISGLLAFSIHVYFLKKGRMEFNTPASLFILASILILSLVQGTVTFLLIMD